MGRVRTSSFAGKHNHEQAIRLSLALSAEKAQENATQQEVKKPEEPKKKEIETLTR